MGLFGNGSNGIERVLDKVASGNALLLSELSKLNERIAGLSRAIDKQSTEITRRFDGQEADLKAAVARRNGNGRAAAAVKKQAIPVGGGIGVGGFLAWLAERLIQ